MKKMPVFKRVMIKLSGEALAGDKQFSIDPNMLSYIADELISIHQLDVQIGVVVGGGNIFRGIGSESLGLERTVVDQMGMLATVINALALQNALEQKGCATRVQTAIEMSKVAEPFIRRRAIRHMEKRRIVIFAAGTGNPYFTTDSAAALRGIEIGADVVLKATKVDGVYTSDPEFDKAATLLSEITYMDVLRLNLRVMDMTSVTLCQENKLPVIVFNIFTKDNLKKIILGEHLGTIVREGNQTANMQ